MRLPICLRVLLTVLPILALAAPAAADVVRSYNLDIRLRFENLDKYPDHNFYLKYGLGNGNPWASLHLTRVEGRDVIRLEGQGSRVTPVYLLAVPRGRQAPTPPSDSVRDHWLEDTPTGCLQSSSLSVSSGGETVYRVRMDGNRLEVDWLDTIYPPLWSQAWTWVAGICLSFAAITAGLLWIRRRRSRNDRSPSAEATIPAPPELGPVADGSGG